MMGFRVPVMCPNAGACKAQLQTWCAKQSQSTEQGGQSHPLVLHAAFNRWQC